MPDIRLDRWLEALTSINVLVALLWLGLAALSVALVVLMRTRWGQSRPLRKCVALSILAHLLFFGYATTIEIVSAIEPPGEEVMHVSLVDASRDQASNPPPRQSPDEPWEQFAAEKTAEPTPVEVERQPPAEAPDPQRRTRIEPSALPDRPPIDALAMVEMADLEPELSVQQGATGSGGARKDAEAIEVPAAQRREAPLPSVPMLQAPVAATTEVAPLKARARLSGVHAALVEQLGPLPRLSDAPVTAEPADSLASLVDQLAPLPRNLAETVARASDDASYAHASSAAAIADPAAMGPAAGSPGASPTTVPRGAPRGSAPSLGDLASRYRGPGIESDSAAAGEVRVGPPRVGPPSAGAADGSAMPEPYRLRVAPDRAQQAIRQGATPESEAAVRAALAWLSSNQHADGRWDSSDHGGGREMYVLGRNRQGAGAEADTGMTGLALLAFLAAGHTHRDGEHRQSVHRGLEYLVRVQAADGNLAGKAETYARMYCHAMATFALGEAYGMTHDPRLRAPLEKAVGYTLAAQSPTTGGWRYAPRDPGDTSQLGWQWMALKSAELAGLSVPDEAKQGVAKYLRSVSAGQAGGLAAYRPGERVSPAMTAEAMVCWLFLGLPASHPACDEAAGYLTAQLPGQGEVNFYYWYYGTLTMYQLQGAAWQRWNDALQKTLITSQRKSGPAAGSWDPTCIWGGYGGRVYTTALGALCLEVYYRYLPLLIDASKARQ